MLKLRTVPISIVMFLLALTGAVAAQQPIYKDPTAPVEQRIDDLLPLLTLEEKLSMIHGDAATGMDTAAVERLGIPRISTTDGPHGVRWDKSTCFPTGVSLGATWNPELLVRVGHALGRETLARGRNMLLGPCINIHRQPFGGRNFESFSEDPLLAGRLAAAYVQGVQAEHVIATPKHYAVNNQEFDRMTVSAEISERALREIYLPHFKDAIQDGGAWSIMCSYNRINGVYACEDNHILTDILKKEWGFKGFVVSDWGAVHSTVGTALSGMDVEMPNGAFLGEDLLAAIKAGEVPESAVDAMVRNVLRVMFESGIFDGKAVGDPAWAESDEHRALAREAGREGIVLLKNDNNVLPLNRDEIRTLAVIGPLADQPTLGGGGSSQVDPTYRVSPLDGIRQVAGEGVEIRYVPGCDLHMEMKFEAIPAESLSSVPADQVYKGPRGLRAEYFKGSDFQGEPVAIAIESDLTHNWGAREALPEGLNRDNFSMRWSGSITIPANGEYEFVLGANDGSARLFIRGKAKLSVYALNGVPQSKSWKAKIPAGTYDIKLEYQGTGTRALVRLGWVRPDRDPMDAATQAAADSDAALVFVGLDRNIEGEGNDRETLDLPGLQDELIAAVTAANPRTAVVLVNGTPVTMTPWLDKTPALVEAFYPGQEGGLSIADVLFGDADAAGRMPVSFPESWEKSAAYDNYPGADGKVLYDEGVFVGYRWHDTRDVAPLFPFGFGLSYTSFEYSNLNISPASMGTDDTVTVSVDVKNTGAAAGSEVVQLYVHDAEAGAPRPVRELKAFEKIKLKPGETRTVSMTLDRDALSYFSPDKNAWTAEPGEFEIQVGRSSRDIRLTGKLILK